MTHTLKLKRPLRLSLGWQILIGLALGIGLGTLFYGNKSAMLAMSSIGTMFIRLIQMVVMPIVFSCLVLGIMSMGDMKQLGRVGIKTIIYFEIMTTLAIILGLTVGNVFHPGQGVNLQHLASSDISQYVATAKTVSHHGVWDTLIDIIPVNVFSSLANGDMMPVIFFAVFFGLGTAALGERGKIMEDVMQVVADAMFHVTNWVMKAAPIGVCALMGNTVAQMGLQALGPLAWFIVLTYLTMIFFVLIIMGSVAWVFKLNMGHLLITIKNEMVLAFSTASSEAVLPKMIDKMTHYGVDSSIVSFVIPTGYTFNLDGSAIYQSIAALFLAQAYGIHLSLGHQVTLLLVLIITSKGMAGVPGASFVVLLATLSTVGVPMSGLAFIAGIDRLIDMGRTAVNVVGNSLATVIIGQLEGQFHPRDAKARRL